MPLLTSNISQSLDLRHRRSGLDSDTMSFDQLKREAVNLERKLEDKVSRYQQVCGLIVEVFALGAARTHRLPDRAKIEPSGH